MKFILILSTLFLVGALSHEDDIAPDFDAVVEPMHNADDDFSIANLMQVAKKKTTGFKDKMTAEIAAADKAVTSFMTANKKAGTPKRKCKLIKGRFCSNAGNKGARTFKPVRLQTCAKMCGRLEGCTSGYWDKGGEICRLFGVKGAKAKQCKFNARLKKHPDYTVIQCDKKKIKKAKKGGPVYVTTTITFGKALGFSQWMYKNICPLAAQQMLMCHRCPQKDGTCVEYFKFRNEESFKKYKTAKWMPKPFMAKFVRSGTGTNGYTVISKAAYEKGKRNGCQRVNPPPVYAKTTIIFGKVIKGYKQWHYNTICPIAAQNMRACYRCPQKNGHCLEYFKFRNRASFLGYQKYKWLKKSYLQRFMDSGTRTTGYEEINQAEYEAGRKAASCSKVQPAPKK
jgi:hypothetical protein